MADPINPTDPVTLTVWAKIALWTTGVVLSMAGWVGGRQVKRIDKLEQSKLSIPEYRNDMREIKSDAHESEKRIMQKMDDITDIFIGKHDETQKFMHTIVANALKDKK